MQNNMSGRACGGENGQPWASGPLVLLKRSEAPPGESGGVTIYSASVSRGEV